MHVHAPHYAGNVPALLQWNPRAARGEVSLELASIYGQLLTSTIKAVETSESEHLKAHVKAVKELAGDKGKPVEVLEKALSAGWTPDYFIGAELQIAAQLTMSTQRERKLDATGGVAWGPIKIEASFGQTFAQGTQTNLSVNAILKRQSRSQGLEYALSALGAPESPEVDVPGA